MKLLKKLNQKFLPLRFLLRLVISSISVCAFAVLTQNPQIFPGAVSSIFSGHTRDLTELPPGVESIFISTEDEERIELWRLPKSSARVAIIFHGNAGDVGNFFSYQKYFESIGITSYGFDYRGYGLSTGWPSERGLYLDAQAVTNYVMQREKIKSDSLILVGVSIGSGAAAHAANEFDVGTLVLFTPFTSMPDAIQATPVLGILSPFSFYSFPVQQHVTELKDTCLIVAHGKKDNVIPFAQGQAVYQAYRGKGYRKFLSSAESSHNDLFFRLHGQLTKSLESCWNQS